MNRIYERDTDALFLHSFRTNPGFVRQFVEIAAGIDTDEMPRAMGQTKHRRDTGSIDIELRFPDGMVLLIENKIDAGYSISRSGEGQADRYKRSAQSLRASGIDGRSVLLAPAAYLAATRGDGAFDSRVRYEDLRPALTDDDAELLGQAIDQASAPYEPVANSQTMDFFSNYERFVAERYPTLILKHGPNAGGVRPSGSHTIYFNVPRTLVKHSDAPRPRMSLQCWDSGASSASVKIMIGNWARHADRLDCPDSLIDIGGYLRPAGRSLGLVIDSPRLDTQKRFDEQLPDIVEGLEAAARLQAWWNDSGELLRNWDRVLTG